MDTQTAAQVMATQTALVSVIAELLVLLPDPQRELLRERLAAHVPDPGRIDELEPHYSQLRTEQYAMWDVLLRGPEAGEKDPG
ncbi:MAG: hypothetical protein V4505_19350 [Pseudomonadota bacterium]|jgi:hypothetical protein